MKKYLPDRVIQDIVFYSKKHNIDRVVLFGSRAKETYTERSDIDIAVSGGDFDAFYWDIKENAHSLLMLDVVNMDENISDDLKSEIKKDGVTIYEKIG